MKTSLGTVAGGVLALSLQAQPWLELAVPPASLFVRPGEVVTALMEVCDLPTKVNACQAFLGYSSTYFLDPTPAGCVTAGGGVWDLVIWDSWRDGTGLAGEIDSAVGLDAQGAVGTDADGTVARITLTAGLTEGTTRVVFRPDLVPDPGLVESTYFSDMAAQPVWPVKQNSPWITIDGTPPTLSVTSALQGAVDVLDGASTVVQGTVVVTVEAEDVLAGLVGPPTVMVVDGVQVVGLTTPDVVAPFQYEWSITPATANGRWNLNVQAVDHAGNVTSDTTHFFNVNRNQISGRVELEGFVGTSTVPPHTRTVTFVATGGVSAKTWTLPLSNLAGAVFDYSLSEVPEGTTGLSARTNWHLRRKLPVALDAGGQGPADFTAGFRLRAGDLNANNIVNASDYNVLRLNWLGPAAVADITGNGVVNIADYNLLRQSWFLVGDPP